MRTGMFLIVGLGFLLAVGCHKQANPSDPSDTASPAVAKGTGASGAGGVTAVGPDVGAVTPVTSSALDDAAGGGVNSSMMKKAKDLKASGVGSVNSAQKQGYGATDD